MSYCHEHVSNIEFVLLTSYFDGLKKNLILAVEFKMITYIIISHVKHLFHSHHTD